MMKSVHIVGYRGIKDFTLDGLGRINLLVGVNNSGKTSVLEAVHSLASPLDPMPLFRALDRRGERFVSDESDRFDPRSRPDFAIPYLFSGREIKAGSTFRIESKPGAQFLEAKIIEDAKPEMQLDLGLDRSESVFGRLVLELTSHVGGDPIRLPMSSVGGVRGDFDLRYRAIRPRVLDTWKSHFITVDSFTPDDLIALWNALALTPMEDLVLKALRFLDPTIERIAAVGVRPRQARGGFIIRRQGEVQPVPIGSFGDGIWRILALSITIPHCRGGVLLVDEIDTGLHYTVMSKMWRLVYEAAKEFDVQVFATTHSYDCIYSLAQICQNDEERQAVTIHRIDPSKPKSVRYDEDEITAATEHHIEMR